MTELSLEARRLIVYLRRLDTPTAIERTRGDAAVRGMLEACGVYDLPRLSPSTRPQRVPRISAASSGISLKLLWAVAVAVVSVLGLYGLDAFPNMQRTHLPDAIESSRPPAAVSSEVVKEEARVSEARSASMPVIQSPSPARKRQASLTEELRFLSSVDAEIRAGAYESALRRLRQHRRAALLQEERAAMRVLALCGLEADSVARRERESFLAAFPSSVLGARIRGACGEVANP